MNHTNDSLIFLFTFIAYSIRVADSDNNDDKPCVNKILAKSNHFEINKILCTRSNFENSGFIPKIVKENPLGSRVSRSAWLKSVLYRGGAKTQNPRFPLSVPLFPRALPQSLWASFALQS